MNNIITEIYECLRDGVSYRFMGVDYDVSDRSERIVLLEYVLTTYDISDAQAFTLSDLLLYEELTDKHPDKMTREEYPFMSEYQLARRRAGVHRRKAARGEPPVNSEVGLENAEYIGTDGIDYRYPTRRKRTLREDIWVDEHSRSRNKEVRQKYEAFVSGKTPGVFSINIETGVRTIYNEDSYNRYYNFTDIKGV